MPLPGRLPRRAAAALALLLAAAAGGCVFCGATEERTVGAMSDRTLTLSREPGGATEEIAMEGRAGVREAGGGAAFEGLWDAVARGAPAPGGQGIALTLASTRMPGDTSTLLAAMVLVVPTPLAKGARYPIRGALPPPGATEMPMYWSVWGPRPLAAPGVGQAALRVFHYQSAGMVVRDDFVATGAEGSIEVVERWGHSDALLLRLDLLATDGTGRSVRLRGDVRVTAERYTPPCT